MEFSEKLIEMVKNNPILYNPEHSDYKNTKRKKKIWSEIGCQLEEDGIEVKRKWKNLRDSYTKYLKSARARPRKRAKKKNYINWQWAKHMEHFLPYMPSARNYANNMDVDRKENDDSEPQFIKMEPTLELNDSSDQQEHVEPQMTIGLPVTTNIHSPESHDESSCDRAIANKNENKIPSSINGMLEHLQDTDPTELIFLGYAKTIKSFSLKRQAVTKMKIAQIIMEQELQHQEELSTPSQQPQTDPLRPGEPTQTSFAV